jgi:hypothetical protein
MEILVTPGRGAAGVPVFGEEFFGGVGIDAEVFDSADDFEGGVVASVAFEGEGGIEEILTYAPTGGNEVNALKGGQYSASFSIRGGATGVEDPLGGGDEGAALGSVGARIKGTSRSKNVTPTASDIDTSTEQIRALAHGCVNTIIQVPPSGWSIDAVGVGHFPSLKFQPQQFLVSMFVSFVVHVYDQERPVVAVAGGRNADVRVGVSDPPLSNLLVIRGGLVREI